MKRISLLIFVVNSNCTKGNVLRQIAEVNSRGNDIQKDSCGIAIYRGSSDGTMYVFDIPKKRGRKLRQYIIKDDGTGEGVIVTPIRDLNYTRGVAEGMVADDELGYLYMCLAA